MPAKTTIIRSLWLLCLLPVFLLAIDLIGAAFDRLSAGTIESILLATSNPFIGLFIGLLITAIIQSSSTTTAMAVTAVASGSVTLHDAIPIIMGANLGTTITSMLTSLSFIGNRAVFKKAIAISFVHNLFNTMVIIILFPLELKFGLLARTADYLTGFVHHEEMTGSANTVSVDLPDLSVIYDYMMDLPGGPVLVLIFSFFLLFATIKVISRIILQLIIGKTQSKLHEYVFKKPYKSFLWGALVTGGIQSSSVTTSFVVPLVANSGISFTKAIPFILGANVGTTVTAFIVVLFESQAAVSIAIIHLLFNIVGVVFFRATPVLRSILPFLALRWATVATRFRYTIFLYILLTFFIIPYILILLSTS